jgi:hypothetical protein
MGGNGEGSVGIEGWGWTSRAGGVGGEDAVEWKTSIVRGESPGGEKRTGVASRGVWMVFLHRGAVV